MGYQAWNAYDEDMERARRERIAALPWPVRLYVRTRTALVAGLIGLAIAALAFHQPLRAWLF